MANVSEIWHNDYAGTYDFALRLDNQLSDGEQNLFFSPASISVVMAMCFFGANSTTKSQIGDTLFGRNISDEHVAKIVRDLQQLQNETNDHYTLSFANRAYADKKYAIRKSYQQALQKNFGSPLISVDFGKNGNQLTNEINSWVASKTNDRIQNLILPGVLNSQTALLLVNALYFKAVWSDKFPEANTKQENFYSTPQNTTKVDMMKLEKEKAMYFDDDQVQVLVLQYGGTSASITIILPREKFGLSNVTKNLNGDKLQKYWRSLRKRDVRISLPKFRIEQGFNLNNALKKLGIINAYSDTTADFTAMIEPSSPNVRISDVVHKAFIELNENGTEAAAATYVKMVPMSLPIPDPYPVNFVANHPFLFLLTAGPPFERLILFVGEYYGK